MSPYVGLFRILSFELLTVFSYAVPENIHTPPTERIEICWLAPGVLGWAWGGVGRRGLSETKTFNKIYLDFWVRKI